MHNSFDKVIPQYCSHADKFPYVWRRRRSYVILRMPKTLWFAPETKQFIIGSRLVELLIFPHSKNFRVSWPWSGPVGSDPFLGMYDPESCVIMKWVKLLQADAK